MKQIQYALLFALCGVIASQTSAQFPISVPKINIPTAEKQRSETSGEAGSKVSMDDPYQPVSTQKGGTAPRKTRLATKVLNDAATNFVLATVKDTAGRKDIGWYPEPQLTMLGDVPKRSGIRYVIAKNGKELYTHRCELNNLQKTQRCFDNKKHVAGTGLFEVEIYFIDGDSGNEKLIRKLKLDVHRAAKFKDAPADYYAQRHADAAVGYISIAKFDGRLTLHTFHTRDAELDKQFGFSPFLRCNANGRAIEFRNPTLPGRFESLAYAVMTVPGTNPSGFRDPINFVRQNSELPMAINGKDPYFYDPSKTPGKWECRVMGDSDRTVYRTFRFEIASDGTITPHPEQRSGNVNLADNQTMVEIEIPSGGSTLDQRLLPQPDAGFFYGIPWTTPEGKAAAKRVPKKGKPYPMP